MRGLCKDKLVTSPFVLDGTDHYLYRNPRLNGEQCHVCSKIIPQGAFVAGDNYAMDEEGHYVCLACLDDNVFERWEYQLSNESTVTSLLCLARVGISKDIRSKIIRLARGLRVVNMAKCVVHSEQNVIGAQHLLLGPHSDIGYPRASGTQCPASITFDFGEPVLIDTFWNHNWFHSSYPSECTIEVSSKAIGSSWKIVGQGPLAKGSYWETIEMSDSNRFVRITYTAKHDGKKDGKMSLGVVKFSYQ